MLSHVLLRLVAPPTGGRRIDGKRLGVYAERLGVASHCAPARPPEEKVGGLGGGNRSDRIPGRAWRIYLGGVFSLLGGLVAVLGGLEGFLWRSWVVLGGLGVILERSWPLLGGLRSVLERSSAVLGRLEAVLERSWGGLGPSWGILGRFGSGWGS